jgi:hypothetical protein
MATLTLSFDNTATAAANYIQNEVHTVTQGIGNDAKFFIPNYAPFYLNDFTVYKKVGSLVTLLVENVDYFLALQHIGLTLATGRPVYGGVVINAQEDITTTQYLTSYRAVGGNNWYDISVDTLEAVANIALNPRRVSWEQIHGQPLAYPADINHNNSTDDLTRLGDLIAVLNQVINAIAQSASAGLTAHLAASNPHGITAETIGLGLVQNFAIATSAEALQGAANKYATPATVLYLIGQLAASKQDLLGATTRLTNAETRVSALEAAVAALV